LKIWYEKSNLKYRKFAPKSKVLVDMIVEEIVEEND